MLYICIGNLNRSIRLRCDGKSDCLRIFSGIYLAEGFLQLYNFTSSLADLFGIILEWFEIYQLTN